MARPGQPRPGAARCGRGRRVNLQFVPKYGREAASSRIRVFMLAEEISRQQLADVSVVEPGGNPLGLIRPDVIVVQKRDMTGLSQTNSLTTLVFDYDDDLPQLLPPAARICKGITVDTTARLAKAFPIDIRLEGSLNSPENQRLLDWVKSYPRGFVLPDCIDYAPEKPLPAVDHPAVLCWFGNHGNYNCQGIADAWGKGYVVISDRPQEGRGSIGFEQWLYDSFPTVLRNCGIAMLSHFGQDQAKSNNKLIAAVTFGVPVIVGAGSPSYEELLRECDLGQFICRVPQDVRDCMRELATQAGRQAYLDKIQPLVWERYHVSAIARQAMKIYREVQA